MDTPLPRFRVLALGAALVVVVIVVFGILAFIGTGKNALVALGRAPGSALSSVANGAVSATAPKYSWVPKGQILSDAVFLPQGTYVLLLDPASVTANVYKKNGQSLTQVTFTNTMKYSLAGNAKTGALAFMSVHLTKETDILSLEKADVIALVGGQERFLGTGTDLVGFAGTELGIQKQEGLYAISVADASFGSTRRVGERSIATTDGTKLAQFNSITKAVDLFDVTNGFTRMSYVQSKPLAFTPTTLGFANGVVVALGPSPIATSFLFESLDTSVVRSIATAYPDLPGVPFKFIQNKL